MPGEGGCIAQNDEFHAGSGDSNIHAAQVVEETNLPLFIGTYKGDDDDIAFLSLESINSIYRNEVVERFEKGDISSPFPEYRDDDEVGNMVAVVSATTTKLQNIFEDMKKLLNEMANGNFNIKSATIFLFQKSLSEGDGQIISDNFAAQFN